MLSFTLVGMFYFNKQQHAITVAHSCWGKWKQFRKSLKKAFLLPHLPQAGTVNAVRCWAPVPTLSLTSFCWCTHWLLDLNRWEPNFPNLQSLAHDHNSPQAPLSVFPFTPSLSHWTRPSNLTKDENPCICHRDLDICSSLNNNIHNCLFMFLIYINNMMLQILLWALFSNLYRV